MLNFRAYAPHQGLLLGYTKVYCQHNVFGSICKEVNFFSKSPSRTIDSVGECRQDGHKYSVRRQCVEIVTGAIAVFLHNAGSLIQLSWYRWPYFARANTNHRIIIRSSKASVLITQHSSNVFNQEAAILKSGYLHVIDHKTPKHNTSYSRDVEATIPLTKKVAMDSFL